MRMGGVKQDGGVTRYPTQGCNETSACDWHEAAEPRSFGRSSTNLANFKSDLVHGGMKCCFILVPSPRDPSAISGPSQMLGRVLAAHLRPSVWSEMLLPG